MTINTAKLARMRDDHARLHAEYKSAAERAREAQAEANQLRNLSPSGSPEQKTMQGRILQQPLTVMANTPAEALKVAGIDPRYLRRIVDAQARANTLKSQAEALAPALRRSGLLIARINEFASPLEYL